MAAIFEEILEITANTSELVNAADGVTVRGTIVLPDCETKKGENPVEDNEISRL